MTQIYALTSVILASSDSSSSSSWSMIGLLFFLAGPIFYGYVFLRYRNSDKRFRHEERTRSVKTDLQVRDDLARSLTGLSNSSMQGANNRSVRGSKSLIAGLMDAASQGSVDGVIDQVTRSGPDT